MCIRDSYLGCLLSVDDSIGRLMKYLDKEGLSKDTLVIYCGDQGFYMGEHLSLIHILCPAAPSLGVT